MGEDSSPVWYRVGLFYGILFAVIGAAMGMSKGTPGAQSLESLGVLSIVAFPIIFAISSAFAHIQT